MTKHSGAESVSMRAGRHYIMIGAPVTKVRTPEILKGLMKSAGVDARIETRHIEPEDLDAFMTEIYDDRGIDGLLVTMPHKKAIVPAMADLSGVAQLAGSVNAVKRLPSISLVGAQFDGVGLIQALREQGLRLSDVSVLLAGMGGAGLPIAQAALAQGCKNLTIVEIDGELRDMAALRLREKSTAQVVLLSQPPCGRYDVLINATPLGMQAENPSPFDLDLVQAAEWVADIVADPSSTRLATMARKTGTVLVTGRDMVKCQSKLICDWFLAPTTEQ